MEVISSTQFLVTVISIIVAILIIRFGSYFDKKILQTKGDQQAKLRNIKIVYEIFRIIAIVVIIVLVMFVNGIDVAKTMTSLGIAGIVVGYALQDYLKDIIMGFSIMTEGYYKVGDYVIYKGDVGKIVSFNIKTTRIYLYRTEETVITCNRNLTEISKASDWIDIDIPIGYDVDVQYARLLCRKCCKKIERLRYVYSCDFLNTQNFDDSWISYKIRIHHLTEKRFMVRRNANAVIQDVFKEYNVEFPLNINVLYSGKALEAAANRREIKGVSNGHFGGYDYELGRGAAHSNRVAFDGSETSIEKALKEAERYSRAENLNNKMGLRIRLLSEELLVLAKSWDNIKDGKYYIERTDEDYEIVIDAVAIINKKRKADIKNTIKLTNENNGGVNSTLKTAIDSLIKAREVSENPEETEQLMNDSIGKSNDTLGWSYNVYKDMEESKKNYDNLMTENVLERSVLTSLADDIKITMIANKVKIRVFVKEIEED